MFQKHIYIYTCKKNANSSEGGSRLIYYALFSRKFVFLKEILFYFDGVNFSKTEDSKSKKKRNKSKNKKPRRGQKNKSRKEKKRLGRELSKSKREKIKSRNDLKRERRKMKNKREKRLERERKKEEKRARKEEKQGEKQEKKIVKIWKDWVPKPKPEVENLIRYQQQGGLSINAILCIDG